MTDALEALRADAQAVSHLLKAVANPNRLQILCLLAGGERAVSEFESVLGIRQPSLSQQLALLREAELVTTRRSAKTVYYRLTDGRILPLLAALQVIVTGQPHPLWPPAGAGVPPPPTRAAWVTECGVFSTAGRPGGRDPG
jgi:ArsR family transcriptional regulator